MTCFNKSTVNLKKKMDCVWKVSSSVKLETVLSFEIYHTT